MKRYLIAATLLAGVAGFILLGSGIAQAQNVTKEKEFRIERSMPKEATACIQCHKIEHPGIFGDWANSRHANANVTCYDCHKAESIDPVDLILTPQTSKRPEGTSMHFTLVRALNLDKYPYIAYSRRFLWGCEPSSYDNPRISSRSRA